MVARFLIEAERAIGNDQPIQRPPGIEGLELPETLLNYRLNLRRQRWIARHLLGQLTRQVLDLRQDRPELYNPLAEVPLHSLLAQEGLLRCLPAQVPLEMFIGHGGSVTTLVQTRGRKGLTASWNRHPGSHRQTHPYDGSG